MSKKYTGNATFPHPRKIFRAARILFGMIFLAYGLAGVVYPAILPQAITSAIPSEIFSISRENIILISAFVSMLFGFVLLTNKENF
ncbi:MAG: hypothetical protein KKB25_02845 [Nanoarchaeota archaeon]|nr:hypothetical protein [Nanoarchaeota archaeon]